MATSVTITTKMMITVTMSSHTSLSRQLHRRKQGRACSSAPHVAALSSSTSCSSWTCQCAVRHAQASLHRSRSDGSMLSMHVDDSVRTFLWSPFYRFHKSNNHTGRFVVSCGGIRTHGDGWHNATCSGRFRGG